jgi:TatA/E family protein of Tat protein translocase
MFGIGFQEILVILVVVLIVFGPKKLPELARMLGKAMAEFRRTVSDFKSAVDLEEIEAYKSKEPAKAEPAQPELPSSLSEGSPEPESIPLVEPEKDDNRPDTKPETDVPDR